MFLKIECRTAKNCLTLIIKSWDLSNIGRRIFWVPKSCALLYQKLSLDRTRLILITSSLSLNSTIKRLVPSLLSGRSVSPTAEKGIESILTCGTKEVLNPSVYLDSTIIWLMWCWKGTSRPLSSSSGVINKSFRTRSIQTRFRKLQTLFMCSKTYAKEI